MSYYNESLFDVGNTFYDFFYASNQVSGKLFVSVIGLGALFIIMFAILKFRQNSNDVSLLVSGFLTTFVSIYFYSLELVTWHITLLCILATLGALITFKIVGD